METKCYDMLTYRVSKRLDQEKISFIMKHLKQLINHQLA